MYGKPSKPSWMDIGYDNLSFAEKTREYNRDLMLYEIATNNNYRKNTYNSISIFDIIKIPKYKRKKLNFLLSDIKQDINSSSITIICCLILLFIVYCFEKSLRLNQTNFEIIHPIIIFIYGIIALSLLVFTLVLIRGFIIKLIIFVKLKAFEKANKK